MFKYEVEMTSFAEKWLLTRKMVVKREFDFPWGICDLIGCQFNKRNVAKRLKLGQKQAIGPYFRVMVLSHIPDMEDDRGVTIEGLRKRMNGVFSNAQIATEVSRLVKSKFVVESEHARFSKLNGWYPLHRKIVAVELKLSKISDAIEQAMRNALVADESIVGMPFDVAKRIRYGKKQEDFKLRGIGLLGVSREGCRLLIKPGQCQEDYDLVTQVHCTERFWRTYPISS